MFKEHIIMLWDPSLEIQHSFTDIRPEPWTLHLGQQNSTQYSKTNPTMFPDEFFDSWKPFMLIRHPALTFPSFYRASKEGFGANITDRWVVQGNSYRMDRTMYDWYQQRIIAIGESRKAILEGDSWPVILDMQDMINNKAVMEKFCLMMQLDPEHLRYEWEPAPKEYMEGQTQHMQAFLSSIHASSGLISDKAPQHVSLELEYSKWVTQWGAEDANILKSQVENAMEDYEYLWSKRLVA
jgi:hypothetical protein